MKHPPSFVHCNGNIFAAVDVETTGADPFHHEIIQIAVVPLGTDLAPTKDYPNFYHNIRPLHPERENFAATETHGLDLDYLLRTAAHPDTVADYFSDWFDKLELPFTKKLTPIAHNWAFECGFLKAWLGIPAFDQYFHFHPRDTMLTAIHYNDRSVLAGDERYFKSVALGAMCKHFGIPNTQSHDALSDALTEGRLYKELLKMDLL